MFKHSIAMLIFYEFDTQKDGPFTWIEAICDWQSTQALGYKG
jgi:hypothetical protein